VEHAAKTAGLGALHRFAARQQRKSWLGHRCRACSRNRHARVANNGRHPVECFSGAAIGKPGCGAMQRCSPALALWSNDDADNVLRWSWQMPQMLNLTDTELDIVFAAAQPLALKDRDAFLKDIAERLTALPHLGDGVVHRVCAEVQRRHWDPPVGVEVVGPLPRKYGTR
jgi:hypothetical protein